jgi:hypothetical protein
MSKLNTWFRMTIIPGEGDLVYEKTSLTRGCDTRFEFTDAEVRCIGPDVNLCFPLEWVRGFEAWVE